MHASGSNMDTLRRFTFGGHGLMHSPGVRHVEDSILLHILLQQRLMRRYVSGLTPSVPPFLPLCVTKLVQLQAAHNVMQLYDLFRIRLPCTGCSNNQTPDAMIADPALIRINEEVLFRLWLFALPPLVYSCPLMDCSGESVDPHGLDEDVQLAMAARLTPANPNPRYNDRTCALAKGATERDWRKRHTRHTRHLSLQDIPRRVPRKNGTRTRRCRKGKPAR